MCWALCARDHGAKAKGAECMFFFCERSSRSKSEKTRVMLMALKLRYCITRP